ncbi:MAG: hypothetical protein GY757_34340 [bacterium]|nr:hypothetical protein [bacterium]
MIFILLVISVRALYYLLSNYFQYYYAKKELKKLVLGPVSQRYAASESQETEPPAGLGADCHTGLGSVSHTGLGSVSHTGLGSVSHTGLGPVSHTGLGPVSHTGLGPVELPDAEPFRCKREFKLYYHIISAFGRAFPHAPGSPRYNLGMQRLRERMDFLLKKDSLFSLMGFSLFLLLGSLAYKYMEIYIKILPGRFKEDDLVCYLLLNFGDSLVFVFVIFIVAIFLSLWAYCGVGKKISELWFLITDLEARYLQEGQHVNVVKETENEV